jgi:hypothetical protein
MIGDNSTLTVPVGAMGARSIIAQFADVPRAYRLNMQHFMKASKLSLCAVLAFGLSILPASAQRQPLSSQQIQTIADTAAAVCNTVNSTKGKKSDIQLQGDVAAQLGNIVGLDLGGSGKGYLTHEEFEGLSRDATGKALEGDRGCRERVLTLMFKALISQGDDGKSTGDRLVGSYQVILGPKGGCNGGPPNSYPRPLAASERAFSSSSESIEMERFLLPWAVNLHWMVDSPAAGSAPSHLPMNAPSRPASLFDRNV